MKWKKICRLYMKSKGSKLLAVNVGEVSFYGGSETQIE